MTLYIIHGWTYTIEPWRTTVAYLKKEGITVKMLKVPGLTEPSRKVFTIQDYVKWAEKELPDGAVVLGHSNGGRILLNMLSEKPEKVKHLILLASAGVYEPSRKRDLFRKISKLGAPLKKIKPVAKVYHRLLGATDYDKAPENMKKTLTNMLDSDRDLKIEKVTTPTYILWGEEDMTTPVRQAKVINEKIQGSKLKIYKKWKHAPYISNPVELGKAIVAVLKEIEKEKQD